MPHPHITVGAVTRTVRPERGVVAVVVTDEHGRTTTCRGYRATGRSLDMLAVLMGMLAARKGRAGQPMTVTVTADADLVTAIEAHLADGSILIPEALHQLTAIADKYRVGAAHGVEFRFTVSDTILTAEETEELDRLVETEEAAHARATATWRLPKPDAAWVAKNDATVVYTDGSLLPAAGFGAWAWWVDETRNGHGTLAGVTSTHVERLAVFKALRAVDGPVLVVTDLQGLLPDGRGRAQSGGHERLLRKLRRELERSDVRVLVVKGHATCPGNLAVDRLAGNALGAMWAQISARPDLAGRLVDLAEQRRETTRRRRVEAGIRGSRRYDALRAVKAKRRLTAVAV